MKYIKEYKDWEVNRWKKVKDFGKAKTIDEMEDEIIFVGGFDDDFIKGGDGEEPMNDEQIKKLYKAMVHDVNHNKEEDKEDDAEIDDSLENHGDN